MPSALLFFRALRIGGFGSSRVLRIGGVGSSRALRIGGIGSSRALRYGGLRNKRFAAVFITFFTANSAQYCLHRRRHTQQHAHNNEKYRPHDISRQVTIKGCRPTGTPIDIRIRNINHYDTCGNQQQSRNKCAYIHKYRLFRNRGFNLFRNCHNYKYEERYYNNRKHESQD